MKIGELAVLSGMSADTLRYYERVGLLPRTRRGPNGYRDYPASVQNRLRVIRNAVSLGFPLKEITRVLRVRDEGGSPCRQVRDYAVTIADELDQRITRLQAERRRMRAMIKEWDTRLSGVGDAERAYLLERPRGKRA